MPGKIRTRDAGWNRYSIFVNLDIDRHGSMVFHLGQQADRF